MEFTEQLLVNVVFSERRDRSRESHGLVAISALSFHTLPACTDEFAQASWDHDAATQSAW